MKVSPPRPGAPNGAELSRLVVAIASKKDRDAFGALFRHFAPRIKSYIMRSGVSAAAAEEIVQETMLTVWMKASYYDPARAAASTWLFTIARNLRIDHQRRQRSPAPLAPDPSDDPTPPPSGETIVLDAERDNRVRRALSSLSREQAIIVRLSFYSEKPHPEIARELGIPIGTVKSRIRLAINRLRALMDDAS